MFSTQFRRADAKGKELTRIIHFNDDDFHVHNPTRKEIEFVHELYFSLVTERGKNDTYFVKVVVVNGKFWAAFPVSYNPITKWQQWKINPNPASAYSRFQGRDVNLIGFR